MNTDLLTAVSENALFVLEFLGIVLAFFLVAYIFDKMAKSRNGDNERILNTKAIVLIGMFSAVSTVLMLFEIPMPFAPSFYKLDFSELPALIAGFAYGPVAGVMVEFVKIILKTLIKGTSTAFVGELANFVIGCSLVLPAHLVAFGRFADLSAGTSFVNVRARGQGRRPRAASRPSARLRRDATPHDCPVRRGRNAP